MKVLLINNSDRVGGAAVACNRLAMALSKEGVDIKMLVNKKQSNLSYVVEARQGVCGPIKRNLDFYAERLEIFLHNGYSKKKLFLVSDASAGMSITGMTEFIEADVIHIHWINQGFISMKGLFEIINSGKRIVWTMHDFWPVSSICHYSGDCYNYKTGCGKCNLIGSNYVNDLSHKLFKKKSMMMRDKGITFVGCSRWIANKAKDSAISDGNKVLSIPNPIDTDLFSPGDKVVARKALGLPIDKKLILFGAAIATDKRKGIKYLIDALSIMADSETDFDLVMFGEMKGDFCFPENIRIHQIGYVSDINMLVNMYRASDIFVTPSLEDNLPNMIMEALSTGTICVGFNVGGIPEMIIEGKSGFIAKAKDIKDLALSLQNALKLSADLCNSEFARKFVLENYSEEVVAHKILDIYTN